MADDGGLRPLFRQRLPDLHWQSIESWMTGSGTPDSNACGDGVEFWAEFKRATANAVPVNVFQVGWHERRRRAGGRTFIVVRLLSEAGPRRGEARDDLFVFRGSDVRAVFLGGLRGADSLYHGEGGPSRWSWEKVRLALLRSPLAPLPRGFGTSPVEHPRRGRRGPLLP